MSKKYTRILELPRKKTFFLWGPRQSGKSTLLKEYFPDAFWIDLLLSEVYRRYLTNLEQLIEELRLKNADFVVFDEIQKLPQLPALVHWLIENQGVRFVLCGSSVRKVKRAHANLPGGRGIRFELFGLSALEIGEDLDFVALLNRGSIPQCIYSPIPERGDRRRRPGEKSSGVLRIP